jgi:UDP-GlcNAc3NAcA epimerase
MPEEINRVLTDHVSHWLFAPTEAAVAHLGREAVAAERVHRVGDVMYDAALYFAQRAGQRSTRHAVFATLADRPCVLATVHRAENTDDPARLASIVSALEALAAEIEVVWPLHPRTRRALAGTGLERSTRVLRVTEPLGYLDMLELERRASLVVTDSGGVQKEAFFFGVPCVTVRDETEWVELVEAGWNRLAPPGDAERMLSTLRAALGSTGRPVRPYGDGDAAERIAWVLAAG